ncbi:MAG TPA: hypothetical protein ENL42_02745, partial [Thermoplasmatales archaeon]|nr:hypothetical protein [Thermoplasmatales archaeon]
MRKIVALVGVLVLVASMTSAINGTNGTRDAYIEDTCIVPLHKTIATSNLQGNVQISTGEENDITPTITVDGNGRVVVAYLSQASILEHYIYLAYSEDGSTWELPAYVYTESGVAASPYLDYMPGTGKVTLSYV